MTFSSLEKGEDFFDEPLQSYLEQMRVRGYSPNTIIGYNTHLSRFYEWLQSARSYRNLSDIGRRDLMEFCQVLSTWETRSGTPLSASTKNLYLNALRGFFSQQVKEGRLLSDPTSVVSNFQQQQKLPKVPTYRDILKLIAAIKGQNWRAIRDRAWVEVFYGSGLRLAEMHQLDLTDLCLEEELIHVRLGKGSKDRFVPMTPESRKAVEVYLRQVRSQISTKADSALLLSPRGDRMKKGQFGVWLHKYSERAGLQLPITPHRLRHACASHLLKNGASIRHIQKLLGHKCLSTTQRYTKVDIKDLHEVLAKYHPREHFHGHSN